MTNQNTGLTKRPMKLVLKPLSDIPLLQIKTTILNLSLTSNQKRALKKVGKGQTRT